jgi:predicted AAA+ superfamily ATPase
MERVENRHLFNQANYKDIELSLQTEGIDFSKKAFIALDEIQLVPNISSVVKYLYDTYNIKFIVTGSSSFYIKNHFTESLAGRKRIFEMEPLSFSEYLTFKGEKIPTYSKDNFVKYNLAFHNKYKKHYETYLRFGGFPEVALAGKDADKIEYLKDIVNSYIELDIKLLSDFAVSDDLYKLILLLVERVGSKLDYTKIGSTIGINRQKIKDYINLLEYTYFIKLLPPFTSNRDREIALQQKIYFADNGLLTALGNVNMGALLENMVAVQLARKGKLQYYAKKTGQEIDFILDGKTAIEVKESPSSSDLNTLENRAASIKLNNIHLIGLKQSNPGFKNFVWAGSLD